MSFIQPLETLLVELTKTRTLYIQLKHKHNEFKAICTPSILRVITGQPGLSLASTRNSTQSYQMEALSPVVDQALDQIHLQLILR